MEQMKRRALMLATLGTNDVTLDGGRVTPREKGEEILERYEELSDRIDLPILRPCLDYLGGLGDEYPELLDRNQGPVVGLYYSDQEVHEATPRERSLDTLFFAEIAERKLRELYPRRKQNKGLRLHGDDAVRLYFVPGNPSPYDAMYNFFEEFFGKKGHEVEERFDRERHDISAPEQWLCCVLPTGGTPAMSSMMLLHAIRHFEANCVQFYVSRDETVTELMVGHNIARSSSRRRFDETLEVLQFRAAARISDKALQESSGTSAAARYAEYRLAFDFRRAREHCRDAVSLLQGGELRRQLERHERALQRLGTVQRLGAEAASHRDQPLLIAEVFYNLEVKYKNGEFVDVLGRCFRLQEALLTWTVEEYTDLRTGKNKTLAGQQEAIAKVPGLKAHLDSYHIRKGQPLRQEREINNMHLYAVARHLAKPEANHSADARERAGRTLKAAEGIEKLAGLRNETIIAHGFRGVSAEELIEAYGSDTLAEDLRESVGRALGVDLSTNPFFELAEKLRF